jgi:hypothetical protein
MFIAISDILDFTPLGHLSLPMAFSKCTQQQTKLIGYVIYILMKSRDLEFKQDLMSMSGDMII